MTEPSNIRVLSDGDASALLPILADVGRIVKESSVGYCVGTIRVTIGGLSTIGKRDPARKIIYRHGKVWRY